MSTSADNKIDEKDRRSDEFSSAGEEDWIDENWIWEVEDRSEKDTRKQPWKSTLGGLVNDQSTGGEDLVKLSVRRPVEGGKGEYDFGVQSSTLAA